MSIMEEYNPFKDMADKELLRIYCDYVSSLYVGGEPVLLDSACSCEIKRRCICSMQDARDISYKIFCNEIVKRYFRKLKFLKK